METAPRALVLRAPGTNCDRETAFALETAGAPAETLHLNELRAKPKRLSEFQILVIPGGFSFGDDAEDDGIEFGDDADDPRSRWQGSLPRRPGRRPARRK